MVQDRNLARKRCGVRFHDRGFQYPVEQVAVIENPVHDMRVQSDGSDVRVGGSVHVPVHGLLIHQHVHVDGEDANEREIAPCPDQGVMAVTPRSAREHF